MVPLPCVSGDSNSRGPPLSGPRVTRALAWARDHSLPPVSPGVRVARGCVPGLGGSRLAGRGRGVNCRPGQYGSVQCGVAGGGHIRAAWHALRRDVLHPSRLPTGALRALRLGAAW